MVEVCVRDHFEELFSLPTKSFKIPKFTSHFFFFFKRTLYIINQYNFKWSHYFGKEKKLLVGRIDKIFTLMTKTIDYLKKKKKKSKSNNFAPIHNCTNIWMWGLKVRAAFSIHKSFSICYF